MNTVIAGPCGVGKSTIAKSFAQEAGPLFFDFDNLRASQMGTGATESSPCSVSTLDLRRCLPPVLNNLSGEFVLDVGGDTVFRSGVNNEERRKQVLWLKNSYSALLVVLIADPETLRQRFSSSKDRNPREFDALWLDLKLIGEPYWLSCADQSIDTTAKSIEASVNEIRRR